MSQMSRRVYLDVSALCRPFDNQDQMRIRLETDAVHLILSQLRTKTLTLIVTAAHDSEIAAIEDWAEREHLQLLLQENGTRFPYDMRCARERAEELAHTGIGVADAAHVAFAEQARADFVTCDDRLLRQCKRLKVAIWFGTPTAYCAKEYLR